MSLKTNNDGVPWRFAKSLLNESSDYGSGPEMPLPTQSCSPNSSSLSKNSSSAWQTVAQVSSKVLDEISQPTRLSANVFATRPIADNFISNPAQAEATTSVDKLLTSKNKKAPLKRRRLSSTSSPQQTRKKNYTKRTKKNQEKSLRKLIDTCTDKQMLFDLLNEDLNKNKNGNVNEESQTEALTEPPVNFANSNIALMAAFEKIIKDFSTSVSDSFLETMLEEFSDRLGDNFLGRMLEKFSDRVGDNFLLTILEKFSDRVGDNFLLTILEKFSDRVSNNFLETMLEKFSDKVKTALLKKFSPIEFLDLLRSDISQVSHQMLNLVSEEDIADYISSKCDSNSFVPILNILLEKTKILTAETKSKIKNVVMEKFSSFELNNLMREILNQLCPTTRSVGEVVVDN